MIYFIYMEYTPNTASSNRMLTYLRSFEKMGISINVIFFLPDKNKSVVPGVFENVKIIYYWKRFFINNRILKYISLWLYKQHFHYRLKKGDKVYVYSHDSLTKWCLKRKRIDLFYEKTECPEVHLAGQGLYVPTLQKHIEMCKKVKGLFVISSQLKKYYINKGVDDSKIHIINMTVDTSRFDRILKQDNHDKYIAYCGTASNNKDGVDNLIKAFAHVVEKHPQYKLYVIGKGLKKDDDSGNRELVEMLHLQDKVVFTGVVSSEEMPQILKNADILALARPNNVQAKYGFPTKLGEYLLTGNPVVVTSVGDIPFFLKDGENALIAPPDNHVLFSEKLIWAINHPLECKKIGESGRKVAMTQFNGLSETRKLYNFITKADTEAL